MHDLGGLRDPQSCHWSDEFQKNQDFCRKSALPGFWDPGFHPCTLNDLVNTAVARRDLAENICMISEGYKAHRGVTGPMNFKKLGHFFGKTCSRIFGAPGCHPSILIDFANTVLASKDSVETICMFWEGWRTHRGGNCSMNFKKLGRFSENRAPGISGFLAAIQAPYLTL